MLYPPYVAAVKSLKLLVFFPTRCCVLLCRCATHCSAMPMVLHKCNTSTSDLSWLVVILQHPSGPQDSHGAKNSRQPLKVFEPLNPLKPLSLFELIEAFEPFESIGPYLLDFGASSGLCAGYSQIR